MVWAGLPTAKSGIRSGCLVVFLHLPACCSFRIQVLFVTFVTSRFLSYRFSFSFSSHCVLCGLVSGFLLIRLVAVISYAQGAHTSLPVLTAFSFLKNSGIEAEALWAYSLQTVKEMVFPCFSVCVNKVAKWGIFIYHINNFLCWISFALMLMFELYALVLWKGLIALKQTSEFLLIFTEQHPQCVLVTI